MLQYVTPMLQSLSVDFIGTHNVFSRCNRCNRRFFRKKYFLKNKIL